MELTLANVKLPQEGHKLGLTGNTTPDLLDIKKILNVTLRQWWKAV